MVCVTLIREHALEFRVETDPAPQGVVALLRDGAVVHDAAFSLDQLHNMHLALGGLIDELATVVATTPPPPPATPGRPIASAGSPMGLPLAPQRQTAAGGG